MKITMKAHYRLAVARILRLAGGDPRMEERIRRLAGLAVVGRSYYLPGSEPITAGSKRAALLGSAF